MRMKMNKLIKIWEWPGTFKFPNKRLISVAKYFMTWCKIHKFELFITQNLVGVKIKIVKIADTQFKLKEKIDTGSKIVNREFIYFKKKVFTPTNPQVKIK